ncbi:MAG: hypothetical protein U9R54_07300, partial [Bacteroidota bacterium]|nr:hypothetical protein [Bacteroidota bacterium]
LAEAYVENIEKNNTLQGYLNYDLGVIKNKLNNHTSVFIKAIYEFGIKTTQNLSSYKSNI